MVSQEVCGARLKILDPGKIIIYCEAMLRMHFNDISCERGARNSRITSPVTPPQKCPGPAASSRAGPSLRPLVPVTALGSPGPDSVNLSVKSFPSSRAQAPCVHTRETGEEFLSVSSRIL